MAEDAKRGTDKPILSSDSFTLEPLRLIQTQTHDKRFTSKNLIKGAIHFQISTLLVMILKPMISETERFVTESVKTLRHTIIHCFESLVRSRIVNRLIHIAFHKLFRLFTQNQR